MKKCRFRTTAAGLIALLLLSGCTASPSSESSNVTTIPAPKETESITITDTANTTADSGSAPYTEEPSEEAVSSANPTEPELPITEPTDLAQETGESAASDATTPIEPINPQPTEPAPTQSTPTEPAPTEPKPTEPSPTEPKPPETTHVHSWGSWTQTTTPTCGSAGTETRTCSGCGEKETRSVAATGAHTWKETAPTCTADGSKSCTVCGAKETVPALGHDWVRHEEEGHWQLVVTCYCGQQFNSSDEWLVHASASSDIDYLNTHAGYEAHQDWVVDKPAQDVCARCGATR